MMINIHIQEYMIDVSLINFLKIFNKIICVKFISIVLKCILLLL